MAGGGVELRSDFGSNGTTQSITAVLNVVQFNYPWVLLVIFLVAFVANSVLTAESSTTVEPIVTGPGGKPLPRSNKKSKEERERRKLKDFSPIRKLIFVWLSAAVIITFVGNAVNIVAHALDEREEGWWCGEAPAVSGVRYESVWDALTNMLFIDIRLRFGVLLQCLPHLAGRYNTFTQHRSSAYMDCCAFGGACNIRGDDSSIFSSA